MRLKGWTKLIFGGLLMLLATLAMVGSVASGDTSSLLMSLTLVACAVALVVRGKRGIAVASTTKLVQGSASPWQDDEERQCPSCGACDVPNSEGGCQYCGNKLE